MLVLQLLLLFIAFFFRTAQALVNEHVPEDLVVHKWTPIKAPENPLARLLKVRTVEARQNTCSVGFEECGNGCCALGSDCCGYGCCDAGSYCDTGGCCQNGKVCSGTVTSNPCASAGYSPCSGDTFCCPTGDTCFRDINNNAGCQGSDSQIATPFTIHQQKTTAVTPTIDPSFTPEISSIAVTSFADTETFSVAVKSPSVSSAQTTPTLDSPASSTTVVTIPGLLSPNSGYAVNPNLFWNSIPYFFIIVIGATFIPMP